MKKIFVLALLTLFIFLIYLTTLDRKIYYLALGDSLALGTTPYHGVDYGYTDYIKDYLKEKKVLEKYVDGYRSNGYRITDLIHDIEDNKKVIEDGKEMTLKNALIKADLVTVSIGLNDFLSKFNTVSLFTEIGNNETRQYIDEISTDLENLLILLRNYCKEEIIFIGFYNPYQNIEKNEKIEQSFSYMNQKYKVLCEKYKVQYIDPTSIFKENKNYLPNPIDIHPSKSGYEAISKLVIDKINETLLK